MSELETEILCASNIISVLRPEPKLDPAVEVQGFILREVEEEVVKLMLKHACGIIGHTGVELNSIRSLLKEAETFIFYLHGFSKRKV